MEQTFTDATAAPSGDLVKEVHAYFGVCMYAAQVLETEMINSLTALETAISAKPIRATFDELYIKHEGMTFGALLNALARHGHIPETLIVELRGLKEERDHLAHRFFRDHHLDEMTVAGCYKMIEELNARYKRFQDLDHRISAHGAAAYQKIGFTPEKLKADTEAIKREMIEEARARYSSSIKL